MPKLDTQADVVIRITGCEKRGKYFAIRYLTSGGEREILLSEEAADDFYARLRDALGDLPATFDDDLPDFLRRLKPGGQLM